MPFRTADTDRLYLCPGCSAPERGPVSGGAVTCSRCATAHALPDRSALPMNRGVIAPANRARIEHLREQAGQKHEVPPTLQAVLGGMHVLPGREQEALAVWQSLRARSEQGDVAASEDLTSLTIMLQELPAMQSDPDICEALSESAHDAAVLPRHKQEHLGSLVRRAVGQGDRERAQRYLAMMNLGPPDLESDSELRVSAAALATFDGDAARVLSLLGEAKDELPIALSLGALASVLRANAHDMAGHLDKAVQSLRELPHPWLLGLVSARFPALRLCVRSAQPYRDLTTREGAKRAASRVRGSAGAFLAFMALVVGVPWIAGGEGSSVVVVVAGVLLAIAVAMIVRARLKGRHAAWLRTHGLALTARVTGGQVTNSVLGDVPLLQLKLKVNAPTGAYDATCDKLVPAPHVVQMIGQVVGVRVNPNKPEEVIFED